VPKTVIQIWFGLIFLVAILSLWPGGLVPSHYQFDKLGHFGAYAALAFLPTLLGRSTRWLVGITVGLAVAGILLEAGQGLVPGRVPSAIDGLANTAGVFVGFLVGRMTAKNKFVAKN